MDKEEEVEVDREIRELVNKMERGNEVICIGCILVFVVLIIIGIRVWCWTGTLL